LKREVFLEQVLLDRQAAETLVNQLTRELRKLISGGVLRPGDKLPSTRNLSRWLDIARNTVAEAYDQLSAEGHLSATVGAGTFVATDADTARLEHARPSDEPIAGPILLSSRGNAIAEMCFASGLHRAFKIFAPSIPALDLFPYDDWRRLLTRASRRLGTNSLYASDRRGWPPLRAAIASHIGPARGVICDPDQVLILSSARQAFYLAALMLANPNDTAWIEEPGYFEVRTSIVSAGLTPIPLPVDDQGLIVSRGRESAAAAKIAYVTPSHQYPTGAIMSLSRREELLQWARTNQSVVVEDDYDGEFRFVGKPTVALWGLDMGQRVIYVGTFSKTLFPSLRLAYLVVPNSLVDSFSAARERLDGHAAALAQAALAEFMESGMYGAHIRRMRGIYRSRQQSLMESAKRHLSGELDIQPSDSGLHLIGRLAAGISDVDLLRRTSNLVGPAPLSRAYLNQDAAVQGMVLGYAAWNDDLIEKGVRLIAGSIERAC
jgi:GntR family transcriptional regulator / MocR family aminotransferase